MRLNTFVRDHLISLTKIKVEATLEEISTQNQPPKENNKTIVKIIK